MREVQFLRFTAETKSWLRSLALTSAVADDLERVEVNSRIGVSLLLTPHDDTPLKITETGPYVRVLFPVQRARGRVFSFSDRGAAIETPHGIAPIEYQDVPLMLTEPDELFLRRLVQSRTEVELRCWRRDDGVTVIFIARGAEIEEAA